MEGNRGALSIVSCYHLPGKRVFSEILSSHSHLGKWPCSLTRSRRSSFSTLAAVGEVQLALGIFPGTERSIDLRTHYHALQKRSCVGVIRYWIRGRSGGSRRGRRLPEPREMVSLVLFGEHKIMIMCIEKCGRTEAMRENAEGNCEIECALEPNNGKMMPIMTGFRLRGERCKPTRLQNRGRSPETSPRLETSQPASSGRARHRTR